MKAYLELELTVEYDHTPEIKSKVTGGDDDHEGWPEKVEITSVKYGGIEIMSAITEWDMRLLEEQVRNEYVKQPPWE